MLLLARAITQNFSNPTNKRLHTSSNTRNQAIIQGDRVNIQSRNSGNTGRNTRRVYVQEEVFEGSNAQNETGNPRVQDSKYFMEQMLLAKQDEAEVLLTDEHNDFLFADASRMEEIEKLSTNICLMDRIQPANNTSDAGPSYDSAFISEVDRKAKHFNKQAQSQFVHDRDIIRYLEKERDKLDLAVNDYKWKNEELQKTHLILKIQMSENEDRYHDTILDLEAKLKKNVDLILKIGNSLQGMFMLGLKPLFVYDLQLKHGLGYPNPYTLKQAISQCLKLYLASSLSNSEIPLNVRDTEDTLNDTSKSQQKMKEKMNDPVDVANKQNCWTIDYKQINALYKDFIPQKELSAKQKYFPSSFIPSDKTLNATSSIPASMPMSKPVTLQTSPDNQRWVNSNKNVISLGMYKVVTTQESQTNEAKSGLSYTRMNVASSVTIQMNKDLHVKNNVLANSKNSAKKVPVYVRKNKQTDNTFANVISYKENVIDVNAANASKEKTLTPKSPDTTYVVLKTRFFEKLAQSKSLDTTSVVSKPKIDVGSISKVKHKVSSASKTKKINLQGNSLSIYMKNIIRTSHIWQKWFESQPNVVWSPVNTTPNVHNRRSTVKPSGFVKKWVVKLPTCPCVVSSCIAGHDLLTEGRESNLYTISISDMAVSSPVCLMSNATLTKSWLWHRRLSHLNFSTINDLTRLDLVDGLPKFKYGKDHFCSACERGKRKKASHPPKLVPMDDYSRYTWVYFLHLKDKTLEIITKFIAQGIMQQFSTARTPQQNGVVERRNRTLVEAARTMLIFSRLPEFLWAEAFDELIAMASKHDCLEPVLQRFNNNNSLAETMNSPSKEDLDNLFGLMFEDYFEKRSSDTPINYAAQPTQFHEDSPSTSSIIVEDHEAPLIETTSDEETSPLSLIEANKFI
ncbi:retrovirus-related pol polyprotein from transposon TNT 1-94 [Tanacetum coccineum]|uniref:Retrovirus-related pol polyprotein from transposon TNT 1-94 n=1 Tax=Tanacetum coccineum TaxID=301880 RepID=A0ABQ5BTU8_9ASTR